MKKIAFVIPLVALPLTLSCNKGKEIIGYRANYTKREVYDDEYLHSSEIAENNADGYQTQLIYTEYGLHGEEVKSIVTTKNEYDDSNHLIKRKTTTEEPSEEINADFKVVKINTYEAVYDGDFLTSESTSETDADGNIRHTYNTSYSETKTDDGHQFTEHSIEKNFKENEYSKWVLNDDKNIDTTSCYDKKDRLTEQEFNKVSNEYEGEEVVDTTHNYSYEKCVYKSENDDSYSKELSSKTTYGSGDVDSKSYKTIATYSEDATKLEQIDYIYDDYEFKKLHAGSKTISRIDLNTLTKYAESYNLKLDKSSNDEEWERSGYSFSQYESKWKKKTFSYLEKCSAKESTINSMIYEYDEYGRPLLVQSKAVSLMANGKKSKIQTNKFKYGDPIPVYKK